MSDPDRRNPRELIEQSARDARTGLNDSVAKTESLTSIAISLKRIADVVDGGAFDLTLLGPQIDTIAWSAGRSFEHGRRQP
ncbi:MAG: hypothetical protein ACJ8DZ_13855 [Allosphingosinicella sp.]